MRQENLQAKVGCREGAKPPAPGPSAAKSPKRSRSKRPAKARTCRCRSKAPPKQVFAPAAGFGILQFLPSQALLQDFLCRLSYRIGQLGRPDNHRVAAPTEHPPLDFSKARKFKPQLHGALVQLP